MCSPLTDIFNHHILVCVYGQGAYMTVMCTIVLVSNLLAKIRQEEMWQTHWLIAPVRKLRLIVLWHRSLLEISFSGSASARTFDCPWQIKARIVIGIERVLGKMYKKKVLGFVYTACDCCRPTRFQSNRKSLRKKIARSICNYVAQRTLSKYSKLVNP